MERLYYLETGRAPIFRDFFYFLSIFTISVNLLAVIWPEIAVIFESFDLNSRSIIPQMVHILTILDIFS